MKMEVCPRCNGSGKGSGGYDPCLVCDGQGEVSPALAERERRRELNRELAYDSVVEKLCALGNELADLPRYDGDAEAALAMLLDVAHKLAEAHKYVTDCAREM